MAFYEGFVRRLRFRPTDPGFGGGISGIHPDTGLPGHERPSDPGYDIDADRGDHIDAGLPPGVPPIGSTLPEPPPGIWPPPSFNRPVAPWPPIPPDATTKPPSPPPGAIWPPINGVPSQKFVVVAGIPGVGWRYVVVDPSLSWGTPLPPAPAPKG